MLEKSRRPRVPNYMLPDSTNELQSEVVLRIVSSLFDIYDLTFIMAALRSRCGHYIFVLFLSIFLFPRLISAVADWTSTILLVLVRF